LAIRAVAAGDALLTLIARSHGKERVQLSPGDIDRVKRIAAEIDKRGASLPDFLRHKLSFPYREGISFAYWASATKGWEGVNALYAVPLRPPRKFFIRNNILSGAWGPGNFFLPVCSVAWAGIRSSSRVSESL
jgi:hypothetical protein